MSVEKMAKLVEGLEKLTNKGKIEWEETEIKDSYQASFTDFTIRLSKHFDSEEQIEFYLLELVDSQGREIETTTSWLLRPVLENSESRLASMYQHARSMALGIEKQLDKILEELEKSENNS